MRLLSIEECFSWLNKREIGFSTRDYPLVSERECFEFALTGEPSRIVALAYLFGDLEGTPSEGGLLTIREWNIGSPGLNSIGHQIIKRMLSLQVDGNVDTAMPLSVEVEAAEKSLIPAILIQTMLFGWDAFYVPASGAFLIFISHDEVAYIIPRKFSFTNDVSVQINQLSTGAAETPYFLLQEGSSATC